MTYTKELHEIYNNINNGGVYGEYIKPLNPVLTDPLFWEVLSANNRYIRWRNYGSSANDNKISDLFWVIHTIFGMTEKQFIEKYTVTFNK